mgnify:CR=1 FL=1
MNYFNPGGKEMPAAVVQPAGEPTIQLRRVLVPGGFGDDWMGVSRDLIERLIEVACLEHALPRSARRAYRGDLVAFDNWMREHRARTLVSARGTDLRCYVAARVETGIETRLLGRLVGSLQQFFQYLHVTGSRSDNPARRLRHAESTRRHFVRRPCANSR